MIEISHLTKVYGSSKVVNDCTWEVPDGVIMGFIGPNGAGKTTHLKMMTGVLRPTSGTVKLNGTDIAADPLEAKKQFGFVSDSPDHFLRLKGVEYLNFMADIYDMPSEGRREFIEDYAKRFGIADALNNKILSYSHGMRQKIMVMGALIHKPPIWILDEPLLGLDPQSAFELKKMMREHADAGNSVLFSTHVLEVAEKLCDRIAVIRKGEIRFTGTLDELRSGYPEGTSLEDIFLQLTGEKQETAEPGTEG
ncbi:MAG: ABC transporter ATP-binding protein [Clostridia bacterium]|nr:ABC transporter ATP-binding protein [Clostridia bacterium]